MLGNPTHTTRKDQNDFFIFNIAKGIFTRAKRDIDYPVEKPISDDPAYENEEINCLYSPSYGLGSAEMKGERRGQQQDGLVFGLTDIENIEEIVTHTITKKRKFNPYAGSTIACAAISKNGRILTTQHLGDARVAVIVRIKNPATGDIQYISAIVTEDHNLDLERIKQNFIPTRDKERREAFIPGIGYKKPGERLEIIVQTNSSRIYRAEVVDHDSQIGVVLVNGGTNCGGAIGDNFIEEAAEDKILRMPDIRSINLQEYAEELIAQKVLGTVDWEVDQIEVLVACDGLFDLLNKDTMGVDFKTTYDCEDFYSIAVTSENIFHLSALKKQFDEESVATFRAPENFANFLRRTLADYDRGSERKILYDNLSIISYDTAKLKTCDETVFMAVCDGHGDGNIFEGYEDGAYVANNMAAKLFAAAKLKLPEDLQIEQGRGIFSTHLGSHLRSEGVRNSMTIFDDIYQTMCKLYTMPAMGTAKNFHRYQFSFTDESTGSLTAITLSDPANMHSKEEDQKQFLSINVVETDGKVTEFSNTEFNYDEEKIIALIRISEKLKAKKTEISKTLKEISEIGKAARGPNPYASEAASAGTTGIFRRIEERAELLRPTTSPTDDFDWDGDLLGIVESFGEGIDSLARDGKGLGGILYDEDEEETAMGTSPKPQSVADFSKLLLGIKSGNSFL